MSTGPVRITVTGQSMIRGDTRADAPKAVPQIAELIDGEVAVTNYEAAVYDPALGQSERDGRFASPASSIDALTSVGFNLLGLGNNHSFDLGVSGITNTLRAVRDRGIGYAGTGDDLGDATRIHYLQTDSARIGFVAAASGLILDGRATDTQPGVNELRMNHDVPHPEDAERILGSVTEARANADIVVVSHHNHHYPGVERPQDFKQLLLSQLPVRLAPPPWLETWAHQLVDAGAQVVAMHGPPFLHGMEVYQGAPIFYSLGNFIFQVPPESTHLEEPIMWESIVAQIDIREGTVEAIKIQPIAMNKVGTGLPNPHDQFDVNEYHRTRGLPRAINGPQARYLLERFAASCEPYGTTVRVTGDTASIALSDDAAELIS